MPHDRDRVGIMVGLPCLRQGGKMIGVFFILLDVAILVAVVVFAVKGLQKFRKWMINRD